MATVKNTSGDYTITVDNGTGTMTINAAYLNVEGNITYVDDLSVTDAFITVAANNTGTVDYMGMVGQTGPTSFAGLRFNVNTNEWEISPSVASNGAPISSYVAISTASGTLPGAPNTSVQFNVANTFTGSSSFLFDDGNSKLTLTGHMAYGNTATPTAVANAVALYSNVMGSGGTGLYFVNGSTGDELVSKSKAIVFNLIF